MFTRSVRNVPLSYLRVTGMLPCMQAFPDWLRTRLTERGWSNADLERASGVSNSIIWRWLSDAPRRPSPANLKKIAGPLGVSYEDLMKLCGYLPGAPSVDVDHDTEARQAALWAVVRDIPRPFWGVFLAASAALADAFATSAPVSGSNTDPISGTESTDSSGESASGPRLANPYHGRRSFAVELVTGVRPVSLAVTA